MSYTALYRKFRPTEFDQVKGQEHIVKTLQNQIEASRIGHAYLFCGTRGTGKTTIAKIFAKAVNCEHPVGGSPCGECEMCKKIASGSSLNVIEMDAASNNSVNDIRDIIEEVGYAPTEGKYKVYIIDEVHMLSTQAFNALLKTLEEPPEYVIFILATTEAHKIPITVLSRCQRYDFKRIDSDTIVARMNELCEAEGATAEKAALNYISKKADGSMRDALSLLDRCLAFSMGENLTYEKVLDVLGSVDTEIFSLLYNAIVSKDAIAALALLDGMVSEGRDLPQFISDFAWYLRNIMLVLCGADTEYMLDVSLAQLNELRENAKKTDTESIMRYIRIVSGLSNNIRFSTQKRITIEVSIIKLCVPEMEKDNTSLAERLTVLEEKIASGNFVQGAVSSQAPAKEAEPEPVKEIDPEILNMSVDDAVKKISLHWPDFISRVNGAAGGVFKQVTPMPRGGNVIELSSKSGSVIGMVSGPEMLDSLKATAKAYTGNDIEFRILSDTKSNAQAEFEFWKNGIAPDVEVEVESESGNSIEDNF
ncbi:MAG: DNA polymerase III subunit gamma/tau [Lachnospiraceae bacterium]|nr:DNA polymerase III subunit gamma/tau [Lachnospiraceae bacterium]